MTNIAIQDLHKSNIMTELEHEDIDVINGGFIPVAIGIASGAAFITGVGIGINLYYSSTSRR